MPAQRQTRMFTRFQSSPDQVDDAVHNFRQAVVPSICDQPGCLGAGLLINQLTGAWASAIYWENEYVWQAESSGVNHERGRALIPLDMQHNRGPAVKRPGRC
jgi:hypothetical protein